MQPNYENTGWLFGLSTHGLNKLMHVYNTVAIVIAFAIAAVSMWRYAFVGFKAGERAFCSVFLSSLLMALTSLALVRTEAYSIPAIVVITVLVAIIFSWASATWNPHAQETLTSGDLSGPAKAALVIALLSLLALYAVYPTYYMLGGRDPGLYLLFSQYIARTGGLNLHLPIGALALKDLDGAIRPSYPAIYNAAQRGLSHDPTQLIPQFQHLFPAVGAIFYSAAGIQGLVRANAFIAALALWGYFVTAKRVAGQWPALISMIALGIDPAVIWEARITLTEALSLAILFGGMAFSWLAIDRQDRVLGAIAGVVLGCGLLNRLDGGFAGLAVLGLAFYASIFAPYLRSVTWATVIGYALASTIGFVDGYYNSHAYFHDLWAGGSLQGAIGLSYGAAVLCSIVLLLPHQSKFVSWLAQKGINWCAKVAIFMLAAWMVFSYFMLPHLAQGLDAHASVELAWYVSPVVYPLFLIGAFFATGWLEWKYCLPLLLLAGASVFVYTFRPGISPDLIWATRRWVPYTIPMLTLFATFCLIAVWRVLSSQQIRQAVLACSVVILGYYGWHSFEVAKPFLFKSMLAGLPRQYEVLARDLRRTLSAAPSQSGAWLVSNDIQIASFLTYYYSIPTILINGPKSDTGHSLNGHLFVGSILPFGDSKLLRRDDICGPYLIHRVGALPRRLYQRCLSASTGIIRPTSSGSFNRTASVLNGAFHTQVGVANREAGSLASSGRSGFLLFGPYIALKPGKYIVRWNGSVNGLVSSSVQGFVDVTANDGGNVLVRKKLSLTPDEQDAGALATVTFNLDSPAHGVEFRMYVRSGIDVTLKSVSLHRTYEAGADLATKGARK